MCGGDRWTRLLSLSCCRYGLVSSRDAIKCGPFRCNQVRSIANPPSGVVQQAHMLGVACERLIDVAFIISSSK